jgi:signal transduction histidine kinase
MEADVPVPRLPAPVETTAYFVVVEALANAVRHADATTVRVRGRLDHDRLEIAVCDDGVGGASIRPAGGLAGLGDRAAALGGAMRLDSQPGRGTTVVVSLPITAPS